MILLGMEELSDESWSVLAAAGIRVVPGRAVDLALPLEDAHIIRKLLYVPPSMRAISIRCGV